MCFSFLFSLNSNTHTDPVYPLCTSGKELPPMDLPPENVFSLFSSSDMEVWRLCAGLTHRGSSSRCKRCLDFPGLMSRWCLPAQSHSQIVKLCHQLSHPGLKSRTTQTQPCSSSDRGGSSQSCSITFASL